MDIVQERLSAGDLTALTDKILVVKFILYVYTQL